MYWTFKFVGSPLPPGESIYRILKFEKDGGEDSKILYN
jgi:hypothetical protein